jgi:hypothetical protein
VGDVVSFSEHKARKEQKKAQSKQIPDKDFDERIERIKLSISRINQLMAELRSASYTNNN